MKVLAAVVLLSIALASSNSPNTDAPTGFDNRSNAVVDDATHQADQAKFDDTETVADGLGPLYNAQSCRECHQHRTSGGTSQVAELRVGHQDRKSTRLNSSHSQISYAVFCLKKKKKKKSQYKNIK